MSVLRALAPAKVNLALHVGARRSDGLHELVSLVQAVSLYDVLELEPSPAEVDEVVCPGVDGPNLAADALAAYRQDSGWDGPPQRLTIDKRIPVAAGMGGGSSDAAAALRLCALAAGPDDPALDLIAPRLGADVPALLRPGLTLVQGAGERVRSLPDLRWYGMLVLPSRERLSTADVYREADRLGVARAADELGERAQAIERAVDAGAPLPLELVCNDLEPAARSLCPAIEEALAAARDAGAQRALVCGSGPAVVGVFADWSDDVEAAAAVLGERFPGAQAVHPVMRGQGAPFA